MHERVISFGRIVRQPSALLALAMSVAALAMVLGVVARYGVVRGGDEGAVAHLWQLLMAAQIPLITFFAIKWLPRAMRQALLVLGILAGTTVANLAAVFFLT